MNSYIVVQADSIQELIEKVNERMTQNYKPTGGVTIDPRVGSTHYIQAMWR